MFSIAYFEVMSNYHFYMVIFVNLARYRVSSFHLPFPPHRIHFTLNYFLINLWWEMSGRKNVSSDGLMALRYSSIVLFFNADTPDTYVLILPLQKLNIVTLYIHTMLVNSYSFDHIIPLSSTEVLYNISLEINWK